MSRAGKARQQSNPTAAVMDERARTAALERLDSDAAASSASAATVRELAGRVALIHEYWHVVDEMGAWRFATVQELREPVLRLAGTRYGAERASLVRLAADLPAAGLFFPSTRASSHARAFSLDSARVAELLDLNEIVADVHAYAVVVRVRKGGELCPRYLSNDGRRRFTSMLYQSGGHIEKLNPDGTSMPVLHGIQGGRNAS